MPGFFKSSGVINASVAALGVAPWQECTLNRVFYRLLLPLVQPRLKLDIEYQLLAVFDLFESRISRSVASTRTTVISMTSVDKA